MGLIVGGEWENRGVGGENGGKDLGRNNFGRPLKAPAALVMLASSGA